MINLSSSKFRLLTLLPLDFDPLDRDRDLSEGEREDLDAAALVFAAAGLGYVCVVDRRRPFSPLKNKSLWTVFLLERVYED